MTGVLWENGTASRAARPCGYYPGRSITPKQLQAAYATRVSDLRHDALPLARALARLFSALP